MNPLLPHLPCLQSASPQSDGSGHGNTGPSAPFGFGATWPGLEPGLDFLQSLGRAAHAPSPPGLDALSQWLTPTLDVEQLERRISELKTVQFWLEQNCRGIAASVQALEVQKLTLLSLQRMNQGLADMAAALQPTPAPAAPPGNSRPVHSEPANAGPETTASAARSEPPASPDQVASDDAAQAHATASSDPAHKAAPAGADALAWWSALSQQFQTLAQQALKSTTGAVAAAGQAQTAPSASSKSSASHTRNTGSAAPATASPRAPRKASRPNKTAAPAAKTSSAPSAPHTVQTAAPRPTRPARSPSRRTPPPGV